MYLGRKMVKKRFLKTINLIHKRLNSGYLQIPVYEGKGVGHLLKALGCEDIDWDCLLHFGL
jgi:hypothetical protein